MSTPSRKAFRVCPQCGAGLDPRVDYCWLCRWEPGGTYAPGAAGVEQAVDAVLADQRARGRPWSLQFSLASILLVITAAGVLLSIFMMAPGLGIAAAILLTPALVRTCWVAARDRARGEPLTTGQKAESFAMFFAATLVALFLGGVASVIAFFALCLTVFPPSFSNSDTGLWLGSLAAGGLVAALVLFVIVRSWRRDD